MADYIEGRRPVLEAMRSGMPLKYILMADNVKRDGLVADLLRKAKNLDVPVRQISKKKLDEISERGSHQGFIAESRPFEYVNGTFLLNAAKDYAEAHEGRALIVVCDHLTDAGNLGAVARSAEAVRASGLVIPNKRAARVTPATYKSSAGAIAHIPVAQVANIPSTLERFKEEGFWVAAASEHSSDVVWKANLKGKIVLVLGNEAEGVSRLALETSDFSVKLPMEGEVSSLNVAQAGTALMYEWLRQNF
ncbi:23S rRNA (guanosine(2251)-2'-O)-methyltransferase RlmB [Parvibacter caecicola]|uniref:23S rRNA (guanosine(2251)-2'-O)-methyltransferase RlmB n=1 Tax=Parvibacter caecicola TaxID=747645 RepID=UPI0027318B94|nr:23S rRNA (guanosine(2251)-2'-O)-methyltransferase RlmB [Parvibacter caecicola]